MSMMREWGQQVRVGGRTSENSGKLIWRMEWKNFMCCCVMFDLTIEMCSVSRIVLSFCLCIVMPVTIVLKSLFSNCCSFTSVEIYNSLYNGYPYNNDGRITVLKINTSSTKPKPFDQVWHAGLLLKLKQTLPST
jgi:hypothetical protein